MGMNDVNSLSHTKWNCKYHIVFASKYRRQVFYREKKEAAGKILRQLCGWKGVTIIEAEARPDHIHILVEIPHNMCCDLEFVTKTIAENIILYTGKSPKNRKDEKK